MTNKTEWVILRGPRKRELTLNIGGKVVRPTKAVRYLGVFFDAHQKGGKKAEESAAALTRVMSNTGPGGIKGFLGGGEKPRKEPRVASTYRTTSTRAIQVVIGTPSIKKLVVYIYIQREMGSYTRQRPGSNEK
ncbi:hypothetical protein JTB14_023125 [Gonioctena quinquepunctata]|nr:hypothetical protein JTB14_023125 [Gonioctena quinquepunctata]